MIITKNSPCKHETSEASERYPGTRFCLDCGTYYQPPPEPVEPQPNRDDAEQAVRTLLAFIGENPDRPGLVDTPARVVKAYLEMTAGLRADPIEHLTKRFPLDDVDGVVSSYDEIILSRDIPFSSMCEHHLLPFTGHAHVAYIPAIGGDVVGLSKLARLVDGFALRPQVQERLTQQVADALQKALDPRAVGVIIHARHTCQCLRGIKKDGSMVTSAMYGAFRDKPESRAELLTLISLGARHE